MILRVARLRRPGAREILLLFVLLSVVAVVVDSLGHSRVQQAGAQILASELFFAWRVSRGGRISRGILVMVTGVSCLAAILRLAVLWNPAIVGLVLVFAIQFVLLVSPPVTARVRRDRDPDPGPAGASGWAGLLAVARRPPNWLLAGGVFLGILVALACGASVEWMTIEGCKPALSDACGTLGRGYPLRWLTATGSVPLIHAGSLVKDCVQWTLVSWAALYACGLWFQPPAPVRSLA